MGDYPWYDLIEGKGDVLQGDIIRDCPIVIPPKGRKDKPEAELYNVIVMSQSCDLVHKKIRIVLVCPTITFEALCAAKSSFKDIKMKKSLIDGLLPGLHLLNKTEIKGVKFPHTVVNFRDVYGVHFDFLYDFAQTQLPRFRLLPPYREGLSQAFARFFMRVGLPTPVDDFS